VLSAMGTVQEVEIGAYAPTRVAKALRTDIFTSSVKFMYLSLVILRIHAY
jgi:hypothetical protein